MKIDEVNSDSETEIFHTKSFTCPFCSVTVPITGDTHNTRYPSFSSSCGYNRTINGPYIERDTIAIDFYRCPKCHNTSIIASNLGNYFKKDFAMFIHPISNAKQFPNYIPEAIREDYEEAYAIVNLSPKASATLSRRCLQGMIRDFWNINKPKLFDAINELKDKVTPSQWKAIDAIRSIGNIGAHMEKDINTIIDVDPDEAEKLLKLIELLVDKWYITRHDEEQLLLDVQQIATEKANEKSNS